jgi:hypothetical protein
MDFLKNNPTYGIKKLMKRFSVCTFHCLRISFGVIFLTFMVSCAAYAGQINIDPAVLKQKLTDIALEKIFNGISSASEEQLKNATYFNDLVKDMAPLGVKLDETNFSEQALSIYNKYKEAVEKGQSPEKVKENLKNLVKADLSAMIYASLDKGSQEIVDDLSGLYEDAKKERDKILKLTEKLEENPDADYAKLLKDIGIKGEALERFEKMEGQLRGVYEKYGDYYKAGSIIYSGMSGNAGDRLEAFFELGSEFGSKVPFIGKFIELYAKVAKEMIEATGRLNKILDERNAGCVGGAYHGSTPLIIKRLENTRNVRFREQFPDITTSACPVDRTKTFWQDVYKNENNSDQIYFWTGDNYVAGKAGYGGAETVKELRKWLKENKHADKADDIQFISQAYNTSPGFPKFQKNCKEIIDKFNNQISRLFPFGYSCRDKNAAYKSFVADRADFQRIIDTSDGWFSYPDKGDWSSFKLWEKIAINLFMEERYIKSSGAFGIACKNAAEKMKNIEIVRISGRVFFKDAEEKSRGYPGVPIEISPMDYVLVECSNLVSRGSEGTYSVYFFMEKDNPFSVDLRADDGINFPADATVNISGGQQRYDDIKLTIESKCSKGERLDAEGNCVPVCKDGEMLDKDGKCVPIDDKCKDGEKRDADGKCVPICPDGEKPDADGNCVPICKPNEKLDPDGNCVAVCKDGEKLNEKGQCVPDGPGSDALDKAKVWLAKAQKQAGIVSENLKTVESVKTEIAAILAANQTALGQSLSPPAEVAEMMAACSEAQTKAQSLQSEIQSAKAVSDSHLSTLKQSYAEVASARKKACQEADQASSSQTPEECMRAASRSAAHAAAARQAARNAQAAADKMKSVYSRIRSQNEMASINQLLGKIPAAIESLNDQISRAESLLADLNPANFNEKRQQALAAAARADEAAQQVPDIVAIIHGLLTDIDPSLAQQAQEVKNQADGVRQTVAAQQQLTAQAAEEISAGAQNADAIAAEATAKIEELAAMRQNLASCQNIDLGANLNDLRTNSDLGEIFGPAAVSDAENATICAGGADAICQDLQDAGCKSDAQCDAGYVCENGKCVSPFDSGYDDYTDTMGQRDSDRSQDRADQVAADQTSQGDRSGFTAGDMDQDIASAQDAVAGKCRKDSQCPPGYVCRGGQCVEKVYECSNDSDCDPGYVCRHGQCVPKSGCSSDADCTGGKVCKDGKCVDPAPAPTQQAALVVSPGNKAVVLNETVNLKAIYTDTDGSTKDVTSEASWNPSSSFSSGDIGVYPVTATYNGLVANSQITVVQEKGMEDITVNQKIITVTFWDSGKQEDGDMIDILINGKVVFPGITLTFAKQSRTITMNADIIVVGFNALNEGSVPPNTASVNFSAVTAGKETQVYRLKKHQSANMNVNYKP